MSTYNPNIHHRRSIRLKGYDYAQAGLYFITMCCQDRICRFGKVVEGKMILNEFGKIAHHEWLKTPEIRNNVTLEEFVVMPNHFHAIVRMLDVGGEKGECDSPEPIAPEPTAPKRNLPLIKKRNSPQQKGENISPRQRSRTGESNSPLQGPSQTVGAIVRGYKSAVTRQLNALGLKGKLWQRNYYEHIIRNQKAYDNISAYIINNPAKWDADKFHKK